MASNLVLTFITLWLMQFKLENVENNFDNMNAF